jgi:non-ribosomal peptide synthetase component F
MLGFMIDKDLSETLQSFSRQQGNTLFMTLLAAFKVLLYRYTGQQDICVGTPVAGRQQQEVEDLIGFFVNTLAIRTEMNGDASFSDLLKQVKKETLDAFEHQELPFEKIVEAVVKERDMSRSPLFQVMFVLRNMPEIPELVMKDVNLSTVPYGHTTSLFDITLFITENEKGLQGAIEYKTELFTEATIRRLVMHFTQLLRSIVIEPQQRIAALPMLGIAEEQLLLESFNDNTMNFPAGKTLVNLFEEQVTKSPDRIAIIFENEQLTYKELNERSNQLAHHLKKKGVQPESLVPLVLDRSLEMMVAILGIQKAGGAYVPVDPEYPGERVQYILEDTRASIALCTQDQISKLSSGNGLEIIAIDSDWSMISQQPITNIEFGPGPQNIAYVIYTSGSTGKPKGVLNEHAGVVNRLLWAQENYGLTLEDSVLQKTTFCFDVSVWELFWPLLTGARLVFRKTGRSKRRNVS